ncbi:protein BREAST CANCER SUSCEPTIBILITY 2 homolog B isoform X2 [Eucalyptus grandis]|uniref:protein BREAST CANCER SUSCEPTIBILITY 2 homolog B isoform X2 n=1 Tax=Eucalyptus grandis TaxID=71139 RepID=UPI00192EE8CC|nr:protein BREAST CANCER SUSCEPTIBILITY 2 homolog B isoform X2 [Eucalyptus grandis]
MSAWQILPGGCGGGDYRWEPCGGHSGAALENEPNGAPTEQRLPNSRLPSMSDLLLQGRSKLLENGDAASRSLPMFRTGSGKSVALKQSSVAKALSVLGDEDGDDFPDPGCSRLLENGDAALQSLPMFQTGSGKSVAPKQSSIAKALSVLGDEDGDDFPDPGCSKLLENGDAASRSLPMFRTGSGKSVALKKSSIAKALSVLGDEDGDDFPDPGQAHVRDFRPDRSSFLFQTGSGKVVSASPTGMERAKTLLGLEEGTDQHDFAGLRPTRRPPIVNNTNRCQLASHLDRKEGLVHADALHSLSAPSISFTCGTSLVETKLKDSGNCSNMQTKMCDIPSKPAPIKFQTAGGRSISISGDALKRARSLLGDPELGDFLNEGNFDSRPFSFLNERETGDNSSNKENDSSMSFLCQGTPKRNHMPNGFITPLRSSSNKACYPKVLEKPSFGDNLINKFDAAVCDSTDRSNFDVACLQKPLTTRSSSSPVIGKSLANGIGPGMNPHVRLSGGSLMDISNRIDITCSGAGKVETRRLKKASFVSPFKRPRSSAFSSPLKSDRLFSSSGLSTSLAKQSLHKGKVSSRYPSQIPRVYVSEYFAGPPQEQNTHIPDQLRRIKPDNAHKFVFTNESGLNGIGAEAFLHMLVQSGASTQHISKGWVTNHYRWIIWKLASYERYYPATTGKFLTTTNVLEELKYRYEREINHGHRSAIKRILEGDASPAAMLVLCVSAIHADDNLKTPSSTTPSNGTLNNNAMRLELTDGWYSVDALLDDLLSKHLMEKKIYIGQKIRIWGARLGGWAAPVSPLEETRTVTLLLHANGTYRAHWADRLGFCKGAGAPLAFRCIKSNGGPIPMTLVGVTRIYPILYRERFCSGDSIVRSERMEMKIRQLYNQRRSLVIEGAVSEFQRSTKDFLLSNDSDSEEGAKILKLLEMSAEPEVLMAEMSPDQLNSFAAYRSRLEVTRQSDMEKSIEKALQDAGLTEREVTAFMRVRVVGLKRRTYHGKSSQEEGFITIWNPTEKQQNDLIEGQAYAITGLVPAKSNSETIYLQARGPTTKWQHLSSREVENFEPFFSPRKAISLSNLGEIPLSSEFDIAAFVLYVGEVYTMANQKRQWIFVTDGSKVEKQAGEYDTSLLAISFFFPPTDDNSFVPINYNLVGSTVGFCNLIKRAKDQMNHLWVAEATENSNYFLSFDPPHFCHLKEAALSTHGWAKVSELIIDELKERVLFIIGGCKN